MNKRKTILFLIFLLAFILRFYKLGIFPISLDWDEASLGYNAYSILKTGRDEYGKLLPIQFRSFGDFKPPFYVYATVIPVAMFGLTEFSTRIVSALAGLSSVVLLYFLMKNLFSHWKLKYINLVTFLFAISPWHIQFSRVAFESNLGLFFFILGIYLFTQLTRSKNMLYLSGLSFVLSMYSYHSLRVISPLMICLLLYFFRRNLWSMKKTIITFLLLILLLISPLIFGLASAGARLSSVTVTKPEILESSIKDIDYDSLQGNSLGRIVHNRRIIYTLEVIKGYLNHWDLSFLFIQGDGPDRHHAPSMGMLYQIEFPLVVCGVYLLVFSKRKSIGRNIILGWFLFAPIASSLTTGTPHAVRALIYLPTYQIFASLALIWLLEKFTRLKNILIPVIVLLYSVNMVYYLDMYYIHGSVEQARDWQWGYKEVVADIAKIRDQFDNVIVTYGYDQPYIYFLFYEKTNPETYQKQWKESSIGRFTRIFDKYEFRNINWEEDKNMFNTLLVGTSSEIPDGQNVLKNIYFPNGTIAFRIAQSDY